MGHRHRSAGRKLARPTDPSANQERKQAPRESDVSPRETLPVIAGRRRCRRPRRPRQTSLLRNSVLSPEVEQTLYQPRSGGMSEPGTVVPGKGK